MNILKKIILIMGIITISTSLFSQTWNYSETGKLGYLTDKTGKECEIFSEITISEEVLEIISNSLTSIWAIPGLEGTKSSVTVSSDNYLFFTIYPKSLQYKETDLNQYLPSGLTFKYENSLFYDVTLKVNEYLPRITGAYVSPKGLLEQLYEGSIMPELYLHGDVLLERIARLENAVMALAKKGVFSKASSVNNEIVLEVVSAYNQNPDITISETLSLLSDKGISASKKDIEAIFMVYLGIIQE